MIRPKQENTIKRTFNFFIYITNQQIIQTEQR